MNKILKILNFVCKEDVSILRTIFFNFHYFSFSTAIKFPVILYKSVRFIKTKGQIIIHAQQIKPMLVTIGKGMYGFQWKNEYTIWEQSGGIIIFEEGVELGKGTYICVGENAILRLGQNVHFGGHARLICMKSITIKSNTIVAWDVHIMDSDFKATINIVTNHINIIEKPIVIGNNNWLCFGCKILKGSITPDFCIVSAGTIINKDFSHVGEKIVLSMIESVKVIAQGIQVKSS